MFVEIKPLYGHLAAGKGLSNLRYISRAFSDLHLKEHKGKSLLFNEGGKQLNRKETKEAISSIKDDFVLNKNIRINKFVISPDPNSKYTDAELKELAANSIRNIQKNNPQADVKVFYAIHRDTDIAHIHLTASGNKLHINEDNLDDLKKITREHEERICDDHGIDLAKEKDLNYFSFIKYSAHLVHDKSINNVLRPYSGYRPIKEFYKRLKEQQQNIFNKVTNHSFFDIHATNNQNEVGKNISLNIPNHILHYRQRLQPKDLLKPESKRLSNELSDEAAADLNRERFDTIIKDSLRSLKAETGEKFRVELGHKEFSGIYQVSIQLISETNEKKETDFTKLELAALNTKLKIGFADEAIRQFNQKNHTGLQLKKQQALGIGNSVPGFAGFGFRLIATHIEGEIAKRKAHLHLKTSIKPTLIEHTDGKLHYNLSLGRSFLFGENIMEKGLNEDEITKLSKNFTQAVRVAKDQTIEKSFDYVCKWGNLQEQHQLRGQLIKAFMENPSVTSALPESTVDSIKNKIDKITDLTRERIAHLLEFGYNPDSGYRGTLVNLKQSFRKGVLKLDSIDSGSHNYSAKIKKGFNRLEKDYLAPFIKDGSVKDLKTFIATLEKDQGFCDLSSSLVSAELKNIKKTLESRADFKKAAIYDSFITHEENEALKVDFASNFKRFLENPSHYHQELIKEKFDKKDVNTLKKRKGFSNVAKGQELKEKDVQFVVRDFHEIYISRFTKNGSIDDIRQVSTIIDDLMAVSTNPNPLIKNEIATIQENLAIAGYDHVKIPENSINKSLIKDNQKKIIRELKVKDSATIDGLRLVDDFSSDVKNQKILNFSVKSGSFSDLNKLERSRIRDTLYQHQLAKVQGLINSNIKLEYAKQFVSGLSFVSPLVARALTIRRGGELLKTLFEKSNSLIGKMANNWNFNKFDNNKAKTFTNESQLLKKVEKDIAKELSADMLPLAATPTPVGVALKAAQFLIGIVNKDEKQKEQQRQSNIELEM
jgi:hypothetical protein